MIKLKGVGKGFLILFPLLMLCSLSQAQAPTGKIVGIVTDQQGLALPGVSVVGMGTTLVGKATAVTDEEGRYRFLALPPGSYTLTYSIAGFKSVVQENIGLNVEQTLTVNVTMQTGLEEEVSVVGQAPLIDVKSTTKGVTLDKNIFNTLPKGRNFESLVTLVAGANNEKEFSGGISVDGASGLENVFLFDGMETSNIIKGWAGQEASMEFIEEIQVKSSGYQAEFGGSTGGVVNVITRSGSNEFHGELIGYYTGHWLTGHERDTLRLSPFDVTKAEHVNYQDLVGKDRMSRWEGGFGLGSYILKDKLWFFISVLPAFRTTTRPVEWRSTGETEEYKEKYRWYNLQGKLSAQLNSNVRIGASFVGNPSSYRGALPDKSGLTGSPTYQFGQVGFDYPSWTFTAYSDLTFGNNLLINVRGGHFFTDTRNQQLLPPGVRYVFQGPGSNGNNGKTQTNAIYPDLVAMYPEYIRPAGWSTYADADGNEIKKNLAARTSGNLDVTYYFDLAGEHAFKTGFQYVQIRHNQDATYKHDLIYLGFGDSYFIYGQEDIKYMGKYGTWSVAKVGDYGYRGKATSNRMAFFVQDSWTIAQKLTLNFGLRAESEDIPSYSDLSGYKDAVLKWGFGDKLAPRLGVIYDVFGDSSLKLFANAAIYYDVLKMDLANYMYGAQQQNFDVYTMDDPEWWTYGNGNYPGTFLNRITLVPAAFETTDKDLKPFSQGEISFGLEKRLKNDLSGSIRFVRKHTYYGIECASITTGGGYTWWISNPGYGVTRPKSQGGLFDDKWPAIPRLKREYMGINLELNKRFSNNWVGGFSYTWSHMWGNWSGLAYTLTGQTMPNLSAVTDQWYQMRTWEMKVRDDTLPTDRPHYAKLWGSYVFDFGLTAGLVAHAYSGTPVTRMLYAPVSWAVDGFYTDGRTPFMVIGNLYIDYSINLGGSTRLNFNINVDNVFDNSKATRIYNRINNARLAWPDELKATGQQDWRDMPYNPNPMYLMPQVFYPPRQVRLGIKFMF